MFFINKITVLTLSKILRHKDKYDMKTKVFLIAIILFFCNSYGQVGIGTLTPNNSAQLDVIANNKGVLIPRVSLTGVTDATTISNGNVESLLVYNNNTAADITPGYYYWFENRWNKLLTATDIDLDVLTVLTYDETTHTLTYVDERNVTHTFNLKNTTNDSFLFDGVTNMLTLKDSDGNNVTVDLTQLAKNTTISIVSFDPLTNIITITDSDANTHPVNVSGLLKAKNGLHVSTDNHVVLGGTLIEGTTIATNGNSLNITGLPVTTQSNANKTMVVDDLTGQLKVAPFKQLSDLNTNVDVNSAGNTLTVTVNSKTDSTPIINDNTVSITGTTLTSSVNGVASSVDLKQAIQGGQKTTTVVDGTNTTVTSTVVGDNTEYKVHVPTATNTVLGVVKEAEMNPTVFINANGELSTNGWAANNIVEVNQNYTITTADVVVLGKATSDITITLPNPVGIKGRKLTIKKSDTANTTYVNVVTAGGSIDGEPDMYTSLPFTGWDFMSDGTNWKIVNKF